MSELWPTETLLLAAAGVLVTAAAAVASSLADTVKEVNTGPAEGGRVGIGISTEGVAGSTFGTVSDYCMSQKCAY